MKYAHFRKMAIQCGFAFMTMPNRGMFRIGNWRPDFADRGGIRAVKIRTFHAALAVSLSVIMALNAAAENTERPASDWLAEVQENLNRPADPEVTALLLSAVMSPPTKYAGVEADPALFETWKTGAGAPVLKNVLAGEPIAASDERFRQLAEYALLKEARDAGLSKLKPNEPAPAGREALRAFWQSSYDEGIALLRRAYPTGLLSADDLGVLRRYSMVAALMGTSAPCVPFEVRLGGDLVEVGKTGPDFVVDRLEAFDVAAAVQAGNPNNVFDHATGWVLIESLQTLMSYETDGDPGRVKPRPGVWPLKDPAQAFRLSEAWKPKPVVLLFAHPTDFWAYHFTLAVEFDALAKAAGHLADFVLVNVSVHDTVMGVDDPFPPKGRIASAAKFPQNAIAFHPTTIDERVRAAGLLQLALPFLSVPMVLDDLGQTVRNAYRERGGEATMVIVDREGRVVWRDRVDAVPKTQFYKEFRWQRLQALAARLADLTTASGRDPSPSQWTLPELWKPGQMEIGSDGPGSSPAGARTTIAMGGLVESSANGLVGLENPEAFGPGLTLWESLPSNQPASMEAKARLDALRAWKTAGIPHEFQVLESALVIRNGLVAKASEIRAGDRVGFRTRADWAGERPVPVDMVFAFGE